MNRPWPALLAQELRLAARHPGDSLAAVLFFVLVAALFPFGSGPAPEALARLAPGALVASALLAALLPLDRLFGADAEDGTLDQLLLSGLSPAALAAAKAAAHFLTTGLPARFDVAEGDPRMCGVLVGVDSSTGKALSVERVEVAGRIAEGGAYDADDGHGSRH